MDEIPDPSSRAILAIQIKTHLDELRAEVQRHAMVIEIDCDRDARIGDLDAAFREMTLAFRQLTASLLRERNALNRAVSLPPEIIGEILSYGDPQGALTASSVCHKWRTSALQRHSLWSLLDMRGRNIERMFTLQLERSGVLPLDLIFYLAEERSSWFNRHIPRELPQLLTRSRSVANILSSTFPEGRSIPLPLLESLHMIMDHNYQSENWLGPHPKLRHLHINCRRSALSQPAPPFTRQLRTLHIHNGSGTASDTLQFILHFPQLQELSLHGFWNGENSPPLSEYTLSNNRIPSPQLIWLQDNSTEFVVQFLIPQLIQPGSSLYIDPFPGERRSSSFSELRNDVVSSIWIDKKQRRAIYNHDTGLTELTLENYEERPDKFKFPRSMNLESVLSLTWINGSPFTVGELSPFRSLVQLSFIYSPLPVGTTTKVTLTSIINDDLVLTCPNLSYIGIILRKSVATSIVFKDDAEDALADFLDTWIEVHGRIFSAIQIQDEIKPNRWAEYIITFQGIVESFELGEVTANLAAPVFPTCLEFLPEATYTEPKSFKGFAQLS